MRSPLSGIIEIEAETQLSLNQWGDVYELMNGWLVKHPDTDFKHRIEDMLKRNYATMINEWQKWKARCRTS